jgi:hypothetical protein
VALVAYDGVLTRIERVAGALDLLGAEVIEAIAMRGPVTAPPIALAPSPRRWYASKLETRGESPTPPSRTPHQPSSPHGEEATEAGRRTSEREIGC